MRGVQICNNSSDLISNAEEWDCTRTLCGNQIEPLVNGEQAYPAMMQAIVAARNQVFLSMYQFDDDEIGSQFVKQLKLASRRGIDVRIILDAWGDIKSFPSVRSSLRGGGVKIRTFHPWYKIFSFNTRYHRKLLLVDGKLGFTGGMNIRDKHLVESYDGNPMRDTVFRIQGPVISSLVALFVSDWIYCGGKRVNIPESFSDSIGGGVKVTVFGAGPPFCRKGLQDVLIESVATATRRVTAITPFFFPDKRLMKAFVQASANGAIIDLLLPTGDFEFLRWCATGYLVDFIQGGGRVFLSPPPYDHSKILVADDSVFIGTVNLDHRSFDVNWEIAMRCRGGQLLNAIKEIIREQKAGSAKLSLRDLKEGYSARILRNSFVGVVGRFL